jgi:glycosyltransferase involved in cell wall biosynthesis
MHANPPTPLRNRPRHSTKESVELESLRQRLARAQEELNFYRSKHQWLLSELNSQRRARQMLEAGVSASYTDTVTRIRTVVNGILPPNKTVIVISKGDEQLLQLEDRPAWHFPQNEHGIYAGHYPADSHEAISQLQSLAARGGEFLLIPNTAFWWLEHYRELKDWLEQFQELMWRDERCAIYRLFSNRARPNSQRSAKTAPVEAAAGPSNTISGRRLADIICLPIIDWDYRFQRPQQLMLRFAAAGHRVFYLANQFRKSGDLYGLRQIALSLWEVSLRGPRYNAYKGVLDEGYCEALLGALSELSVDQSIETALSVVQSPFWWPLAKQAARAFNWRVVYDCMDYHAGFSNSNPLLIEQEHELLSHSDFVVASSAVLARQACRFARNVSVIRNGCDYEHFAKANTRPQGKRPVIGYYGAIAEWFDAELVADLAERRPDWDFVLVGSTFGAEVGRLTGLNNVSLPGEKPYAEIPAWLARFDVAILPFKLTPLTEAANPVKAYEIFASGKPLVSVPLPELSSLPPLARFASTLDEFEREIQMELSQRDEELERRRRDFARENTWDHRFRELSRVLEELLTAPEPKANEVTNRQAPASAVFL